MNIFQSLKHDIFDSNRKKSINQTTHHISNSDDENQNRNKFVIFDSEKFQQHIFSVSKQIRKSKHKNATRRFILKSQKNITSNEFITNNAFRFLNHFIISIIVYVIVENEQLKNNINQHAKKWFDNILNLAQNLKIVKTLNNDYSINIIRLQFFHQVQKNKFIDVQNQLVIAQNQLQEIRKTQQEMTRKKTKITKMKNFRDMYKQRKEILVAKIHTLRINKIFLEKKIQKFKLKKSRFQINFETEKYEYREILLKEIFIVRRNEFFDINKNDFQFFKRDLMNNTFRINRLNTIF